MAESDAMCSSYFSPTKYTCLKSAIPFCMKFSVLENDGKNPGWTVGKSVAYFDVSCRK